jgi:serine protease
MVAGTVALLLSVKPELSAAEVRQVLQMTARPFPADGADNGADPLPVRRCDEPNRFPDSFRDSQCYCTVGLCGAGMLDAAAAVARGQDGVFARIGVEPSAPVAGGTLVLSGSGSLAGTGRRIVAWSWTLVDGGGAVSAFSSATDAASATLQPVAAGTVVVRLTVTDDLGASAGTETRLSVAAAPVAPQPVPPGTGSGGGGTGGGSGGGGAAGGAWLLLLALAGLALRRAPGAARGHHAIGASPPIISHPQADVS